MAVKKPTKAHINRCIKRYGENSEEALAITRLAESGVSYDDVANLLQLDRDDVLASLSGLTPLDDATHTMLVRCLNSLLPKGTERGLFPCKDPVVIPEILRVLVEILHLQRQILALQ